MLGLSVTGFSVADTLAELGAEWSWSPSPPTPSTRGCCRSSGCAPGSGRSRRGAGDLVEFAPEVVIASPGFAPTHPIIAWAQQAGHRAVGRHRARLAGARQGRARRRLAGRLGAHHRDERQDHDDAADGHDDASRAACAPPRSATSASRCSTRCAIPPASTCSSSSSPATSSGTWACRPARPGLAVRERLPEPRRRPPRMARFVRGLPRRQGARLRQHPRRVHLQQIGCRDPGRWSRTPRSSRVRAPSGSTWACPGPSDLGVVDGILVDRAFLEDRRTSALELTTVADLAEQGLAAPHMVANMLAASALARSLEVTPAAIRDALRGVPARPAPHRGHRGRRRASRGWRLEGDEPARGGILARRLSRRGLGRRRSAEGRRHLGPGRQRAGPPRKRRS